ncbi:uncharacterized protein LOC125664365 [Ostrea edulis]|uniref:uncharacterized protein LOC125664365 n=1 Tax=Ostrea edulis TaxID=37623 RepID=UPI0024AF4B8D|nr:uncharacterized protein LOC125664365 [Ostrea edulis]
MKAFLVLVLFCLLVYTVSGQESNERRWNKMKNRPRARLLDVADNKENAQSRTQQKETGSVTNGDGSNQSENRQANQGRRPNFGQRRNSGGQRPSRRNNRWRRPSNGRSEQQKDWSDVLKTSWNTSLSEGSTINERGFVSNNNQIGFLMSRDPLLAPAGFNHSFSMIDFGSGKEAIRVEVYEPPTNKENQSNNTRSWKFWARKKHLCFIFDAPISLFEFSQELQLRSSISWAGPIPLGNLKTFVARQSNRVTDLGSNGAIGRLCGRAAARGMTFTVVADSSVTEPMDTFLVMGQVDPLQPLTSVPYEIKLEPGILA